MLFRSLFAPAGFRDDRELNLKSPLIVHFVEWGSLGESLEIEKWDLLVRVNGQPVRGLADLYQRLDEAGAAGKPVSLVFKRWSGKRDHVYDYVERVLAIEELELVKGEEKERLARK